MATYKRTIVTTYNPPPIPPRGADWSAHWDDEEGEVGRGLSEEDAIEDLVMNHIIPTSRTD